MASESSPSRGGEDSTQVIRIGRSVQIVIEKKSNLTGREKGTNRVGSSMRRCSVLRERRERLGPVLECRIAPEPSDVVPCLDLGRECAQLVRVPEAARDGDVVTPKDGLGLRHVGLSAEGRQHSLYISWRHFDKDDACSK